MKNESPNKMKEHETIPKKKPKKAASICSNTKVSKKNRKSPPEVRVPPTNMSSDDMVGSGYDSIGDKGTDMSLERAQKNTIFGKNNYKTPEEEKEDEQIQAPDDVDAGLYSKEELVQFKLENMDKFLAAKAKQHICRFHQEF